jgi:ATP-dependent Clp protease ATP-binding subunit ClpA
MPAWPIGAARRRRPDLPYKIRLSAMSLLTTVPNTPADLEMPFLLQVKFDEYAKRLAGVSGEIGEPSRAISAGAVAAVSQAPTRSLLTRYVGLNARLTELHTVLASAGVNSMWIRGEPGTGKTALADEFIRARTEKRLSSSMLGGPFYLFNVSMFLTGPPLSWVSAFNKSLEHVERNHGLLIIDHIDDLVKASGEAADRMMQSLLACLESSDDVQAIIISDTKNNESITNAATGILRCFQVMEAEEEKLDRLKPVLMSHFRRLSAVHNIDYSEPVADEIIRLLGRYPGRAFTASKRPEKAISFADKVGAMVRINVFAEPIELAELRDQMGALRDRLDITRQNGAVSSRIAKGILDQLEALRAHYGEVNLTYETRFGPYIKAKRGLDDIESQLGSIESTQPEDRTTEERRDFNTLRDGLLPARAGLAREELMLHQVRPEVTKADVRKVFSDASGVPLSNLSANKLDRLSGLEADLGSEIFGQDAPVKAVAKVWRERELGVSDPSRPAGVLLFTGGTGLGKTELTRVLARWDGGESALPAVLRMSEFKDKSAVSRLTGAAPGLIGFDDGAPTMEECEDKDIVVFDEIDKADPNIYDVMMQILEEGEITLSNGKKISFKGKLMVITTNAVTADDISAEELDRQDEHQEKIRDILCKAASKETGLPLFRPEFIGRVDEVYVYRALDHETALKIMRKELAKINRDYQERGISIDSDDAILRPIIEKHYVPSQGGRSPRQIVKKRIRPMVTDYLMGRMVERKGDESALNEKLRLHYDFASDRFSLACESPEITPPLLSIEGSEILADAPAPDRAAGSDPRLRSG